MTTRMVLLLCTAATAQECVRGNCRGPDTFGVFNYASGAEYEGTWNGEGLRHGLGVWHAPHGASRYAGEFVEGKKQGVGVKTLADGGEVAGEFADGEPSGVGVYSLATGDKYAGEFKAGAMTGFGQLTKKFKDDFFALYGRFDEDKFVEEDKANAEAAAERAEAAAELAEDAQVRARAKSAAKAGDHDLHQFFHRLKIEKRYLFPLIDAKFDLKLLRSLSLAELDSDLASLELPLGVRRLISKGLHESADSDL